jgi:hypothetical protein
MMGTRMLLWESFYWYCYWSYLQLI